MNFFAHFQWIISFPNWCSPPVSFFWVWDVFVFPHITSPSNAHFWRGIAFVISTQGGGQEETVGFVIADDSDKILSNQLCFVGKHSFPILKRQILMPWIGIDIYWAPSRKSVKKKNISRRRRIKDTPYLSDRFLVLCGKYLSLVPMKQSLVPPFLGVTNIVKVPAAEVSDAFGCQSLSPWSPLPQDFMLVTSRIIYWRRFKKTSSHMISMVREPSSWLELCLFMVGQFQSNIYLMGRMFHHSCLSLSFLLKTSPLYLWMMIM